ncbi:MAG: CAP domain-containing protein [Byssovorax sp.]
MAARTTTRLLAPLLGMLAFLTACSGDTQTIAGKSDPKLDDQEDALLLALNDLRKGAGIADPVKVCASLDVSASAHSDDMRDESYLSDKGKDGSTPRSRSCAAGYKPGCGTSVAMAEVVAAGFSDGKSTLPQWTKDEGTKAILLNASLNVVGVGRALGGDQGVWTLDLASEDDASCANP